MLKRIFPIAIILLSIACGNPVKEEKTETIKAEVQAYLTDYNKQYQQLLKISSEAEWLLNTKIVEGDSLTAATAALTNEKFAAFTGSIKNIETAKKYLAQKEKLTSLQVRQLNTILYAAGGNPATATKIVKEKIKADTKQTSDLFGFDYQIDGKSVTTNDIDKILKESTDEAERLKAWEASKDVGKILKKGLVNLQKLRNESVQALDYKNYFDYQVSEYGMTSEEMTTLCHDIIKDIWPLYRELHTWARYKLAKKYNKDVPELLPAHWLPNRWGQDWLGLIEVEGFDLDKKLATKDAKWIVNKAEDFYVSLNFDKLPKSFYERSSLYPLPKDAKYKKNNHASAWHMDNDKDVRSLMSIEPNTEWWETTLHELGHIYYYRAYSNPNVPIILRGGANRGFHEAMGSLLGLASMQKPFLVQMDLMDEKTKLDSTQILLKEALNYIVMLPWGAGVMTDFEYDMYAGNLSKNEYNKRWWELKAKYQGIAPPTKRGEEYCDAASKTHINNDAAQYYDYAISYVLLFQMHDYIAKNILKQNPHATNYYGNWGVGDFLKKLMTPGATKDWKKLFKEVLGNDMSAQPMVDYFAPLMEYLKKQNRGRTYTLPETI